MPAWVFQGNKEHFQELLSIPAEPECFPAVPRGCTQDRLSSQPGCSGWDTGALTMPDPKPGHEAEGDVCPAEIPTKEEGLI